MVDDELARLYGVATRVLNPTVRRNLDRFPDDFMLQLSTEEFAQLQAQDTESSGRGGRRY